LDFDHSYQYPIIHLNALALFHNFTDYQKGNSKLEMDNYLIFSP